MLLHLQEVLPSRIDCHIETNLESQDEFKDCHTRARLILHPDRQSLYNLTVLEEELERLSFIALTETSKKYDLRQLCRKTY